MDALWLSRLQFALTAGFSNVEFRQGQIESLPVEDASADVVISNCVINLSPDKPQVFREVCRAGSECDQIVPKNAHDIRNMRNMQM